MNSQFARCLMGIGLLFLSVGSALGEQPEGALKIFFWSHPLRHDWDGDGVPENEEVTVKVFGDAAGWDYDMFDNGTDPPFIPVCPDGHKTAAGSAYAHVHLNHSFPLQGLFDGEWETVTADMLEAYWDNYYDGYSKEGTYDLSENCFGRAFGKGTYIKDGVYGAEIIRTEEWETASQSDSEVAYRDGIHAITVTPKLCMNEVTFWYILKESSEKNSASAVYKKTGDCPNGVSLKGGPYVWWKKKTP